MAEREPVTGACPDDRARTCGVGVEPRRGQASHQGSRYAAGLALDQIGGRCQFIDRAANGHRELTAVGVELSAVVDQWADAGGAEREVRDTPAPGPAGGVGDDDGQGVGDGAGQQTEHILTNLRGERVGIAGKHQHDVLTPHVGGIDPGCRHHRTGGRRDDAGHAATGCPLRHDPSGLGRDHGVLVGRWGAQPQGLREDLARQHDRDRCGHPGQSRRQQGSEIGALGHLRPAEQGRDHQWCRHRRSRPRRARPRGIPLMAGGLWRARALRRRCPRRTPRRA